MSISGGPTEGRSAENRSSENRGAQDQGGQGPVADGHDDLVPPPPPADFESTRAGGAGGPGSGGPGSGGSGADWPTVGGTAAGGPDIGEPSTAATGTTTGTTTATATETKLPQQSHGCSRVGPRTGPIVWGALILAFCGYTAQRAFGSGELDTAWWITATVIGLGVLLLVVGAVILLRGKR
ncbi:hypothetical protein [Leucobacter tenebrionis]|uniref:hypothetical protein n=1 Tax=Leucobacter tenebrionis TaxID=2873270 RepID=UPI001CA75389|nr:hypothetical protein [Leucobacter tenebrionis]QZY53000.1 hypothetical protein KVY00_06090 [Leucobacter tenebrionis]